jgi:hypothetical protein
MGQTPAIDRAWIATQITKGIDAERSLATDAKTRADSPPDPILSVLYHEIAAADERHASVVETIAARYGHTPLASTGGGIGKALGQLRDKFVGVGSDALDQLILDVTAKAQSVHWHTAWVHAFGAIGDSESARELSVVLSEEAAHRDILQQALNRLVEQRASGAAEIKPGATLSNTTPKV